jgi:histone-lysine N-methyltransferase SETD3
VLLQIAAGEPLLLSYGKLSNDFLLMDYGFVVPGNEHDRVALRFDIELVKVR